MDKTNLEQSIKRTMEFKLSFFRKLFKILKEKMNIDTILICGSSLLSNYPSNDIDVFFREQDNINFKLLLTHFKDYVVFNSNNAITIKYENQIIQFCKYTKQDLKTLVESFDFAHIKVGLVYTIGGGVKEVYISDDAIISAFNRTTYYTGSEYPLSSLLRLNKYTKSLNLSKHIIKQETLKILADIMTRGFKNYDDLKDQLDAIDMAGVVDKETFDKLKTLCEEGEK